MINQALLSSNSSADVALLNAKKAQAEKNINDIEASAQDFEAVFITEMLKPMFEGLELDAPFNGGKGEEVFNGFLLQEYGKMAAKTGTFGIADHVRRELINIQEQANNDTIR